MKYLIFIGFIATVVIGCALQKQTHRQTINHYPEYGHYPKTLQQQAADLEFIASAEKRYKSRTKASKKYSDFGWYYFQKGILDTSMFRFNQAWLLDTTNANLYWGFAALTGHYGQFN